jgi:hypothetical protein
VLRVGVLVTYTASADEVFHERAECWLDVPSRLELPEQAVRGMRRFIASGPAAGAEPDFAAIPAAIAQAHRLLDKKFSERCTTIAGGSARDAAEAELARAKKYYVEALASLERRHASAAPDRQALLAARADGVRAEEKRRLAEIEEKYASRHEIRPYRLYLLQVPVLRLPVDVLRGTRRFPQTLDWMLPAGAFAPVNCPGCGADTARWPLVAAKTGLGCASCLPGSAAEPAAPAVAGVSAGPARDRSRESAAPAPVRVAGGLAGTSGYVSTGRADYTYLLRWHPQTRLVGEVLPFVSWVSARLPSARWLRGPGEARMFDGLPEPDADLDPVAVRLWRKALATHGLPLALRCLAAWWRIGDGPQLLAGHRPSVLAAAIHRMIAYRAAETGATHDAIADLYGVAASDTRAVTPVLQTRLQLTAAQPW